MIPQATRRMESCKNDLDPFVSAWDLEIESNGHEDSRKELQLGNELSLDNLEYLENISPDLEMTEYLVACPQDHSGGPSLIKSEDSMFDPNILPATNNWHGEHKFNICFGETKKSTASWTYSKIRDKLFVNMDKPCPVSFSVDSSPPSGCYIRAMAIFSKPEHQMCAVKRCLNHSSLDDSSNFGSCAPLDHLIRCTSFQAQYCSVPRHSVAIPYENPHPGANYTTYIYKFMCLGTCVGGINRRPLQVVFTLENNGQVIGRRALNVKVCASPFRDRKAEEGSDKFLKNIKNDDQGSDIISPPCKKKKIMKKPDDVYTLEVRGYENYTILKKVRDGLEALKNESSDGD